MRLVAVEWGTELRRVEVDQLLNVNPTLYSGATRGEESNLIGNIIHIHISIPSLKLLSVMLSS